MDNFAIGIAGSVVFLILLALGVHIGVALGVVGLVGLAAMIGLSAAISMAVNTVYFFVTEYSFVLLPLFVLMGLTAARGGIAADMYEGFEKLFGRIPGASGIATVAACAAFGTVTGSAIVASTTFARVSAPQLRKLGYDKRLTYGLIASSGTIAMLIPPSALAVVYGLMSGDSVGKLLLAGIGPGVLLTLLFSLGILVIAYTNPALVGTSRLKVVGGKEKILAILKMWPAAVVAILMIGGIYAGVFTVVEAGAIGAFAILLIGFVSRRLHWADIKESLIEAIVVCVMIFFIFFAARIFSRFLALSGISPFFARSVLDLDLSPMLLVIAMNMVFIIFGCFLDSVSMIVIFVPLFTPVITALGINTIWFATVVIVSIHIGLITPPVGLCVYGTKGVAENDVSLEDIFIGTLPFFLLMLVCLVLIIAFPQICTFLL